LTITLLTNSCEAAKLQKAAAEAWGRYVTRTEERITGEQADPKRFLWVDTLPEADRKAAEEELRRGGTVIRKLKTHDNDRPIHAPGALIHHWVGTAFVPGATVERAITLLQDYDNHSKVYQPEVETSRLISRKGDDFQAFLRFRKKKVITVVLNTYHDAHYFLVDATHAHSRSYTTKIAEVENPGTPQERERTPDKQNGFMWNLNTYWRFEERDGGLYIQCEALTLTRDLPVGLGWIITPFITSIPRESLTSTLTATRGALMK
jgi:hypothetical protein